MLEKGRQYRERILEKQEDSVKKEFDQCSFKPKLNDNFNNSVQAFKDI